MHLVQNQQSYAIIQHNVNKYKVTKIIRILHLVEKTYGRVPTLNRTNPEDELVRTVLSQNTNDRNSLAAFANLKKRYKTWDNVLRADRHEIADTIRHAGLADIKAARIKDVLAEIKRREGKISLANLSKLDIDSAMSYLMSLKGVGPKTASCVLLFSFNKPVMPVDTHIFRVTKRLALIGESTNIVKAHDLLTKLVPKSLIYQFHLGIIKHGRTTCKAQDPKCGSCVLYRLCGFKKKTFYRKTSKRCR